MPLLLCLALTACAGSALEASGLYTSAVTLAPDLENVEEAAHTLSFLVDLDAREGVFPAEDGTELATYSYQLPVMSVIREDGSVLNAGNAQTEAEQRALATADAFNEGFREWTAAADFPELQELARQSYTDFQAAGRTWEIPLYQNLNCVFYQTERLVSVSGSFHIYSGGAHPNTVLLGWNFDLETGGFFFADRLLEDPDVVAEELARQAGERDVSFWEDCGETLAGWSDFAAVTFDGSDMTVAYSPYALASYADGPQIFTVSRQWLEPHLNDYGRSVLG